MVTVTRTYMIDDLDGTTEEDVSTVMFSVDKVAYEIDLGPANADRLRETLAKFVEAGKDITPQKARQVKRGKAAPVPSTKDQTQAVRDWAQKNGYQVSARGRISKAVQEAFDTAH